MSEDNGIAQGDVGKTPARDSSNKKKVQNQFCDDKKVPHQNKSSDKHDQTVKASQRSACRENFFQTGDRDHSSLQHQGLHCPPPYAISVKWYLQP